MAPPDQAADTAIGHATIAGPKAIPLGRRPRSKGRSVFAGTLPVKA